MQHTRILAKRGAAARRELERTRVRDLRTGGPVAAVGGTIGVTYSARVFPS